MGRVILKKEKRPDLTKPMIKVPVLKPKQWSAR